MPLTVPSPLSKGTRLPERPHHYVSGVEGVVEIESQWTARKRNPLGMGLRPVDQNQNPRSVSAKNAKIRKGYL